VDVNAASKEALLRVPGLGVRSVERILRIRRYHRLTLADLAKMRVPIQRAKHFLADAARLLDSLVLPERLLVAPEQLPLFAAREAVTGEF
jgi:predicted DNA-binding helix-hairpin-helix protein